MLPRDGCTRGVIGAHIWPQRAACESGLHVACARGPSWHPGTPAPEGALPGAACGFPRCSRQRRRRPYGIVGRGGQALDRCLTGGYIPRHIPLASAGGTARLTDVIRPSMSALPGVEEPSERHSEVPDSYALCSSGFVRPYGDDVRTAPRRAPRGRAGRRPEPGTRNRKPNGETADGSRGAARRAASPRRSRSPRPAGGRLTGARRQPSRSGRVRNVREGNPAARRPGKASPTSRAGTVARGEWGGGFPQPAGPVQRADPRTSHGTPRPAPGKGA
jgi:hypothetical protein